MGFDCKRCNVCEELVGKQENERTHYFGNAGASVLVLDDCEELEYCMVGMDMAQKLLSTRTDFTYTTTVRCNSAGLDREKKRKVLARCSVWTNSLLENRSIILATRNGLLQMR